ncbi:MAG: zinc-ribbon domain containing protein [Planctomycetes bacterium]|nr:zinc-ribbon domain containing protein [Planctomycetota bacterium]
MELADKTLKCGLCGNDFVFTADEQKFFQEKGFQNEPKRCLACRKVKRQERRRSFGGREGKFTKTEVTCATCGKTTEVPFKPVQNRPVYCNECFAKMKAEGTGNQ